MLQLTRKRVLLLSGLPVLLLVAFLSLRFILFLSRPAEKGGQEQVVFVKEGLSLREVAQDLENRKIISSRVLFMLYARGMGYSTKIKAGEYALSAGMTPSEILEKLAKGLVIAYPVTIPEGYTREQIAELLSQKGITAPEEFLSLTKDKGLLNRYGISGPSLEGYLFPDTYLFSRYAHAGAVIDTMIKHFHQKVAPFRERVNELGMEMSEVVTLASIVEKETGKADERPLIASVFLNRLRLGMRLESDPTVIYGIPDFDGNLKKKHLTETSPYNTYVISGLPPGPIANPGLDSIKAVLFPAETKYLYFVSKNDGSHHFSTTLPEHNRAVQIYQKSRGRSRQKTS